MAKKNSTKTATKEALAASEPRLVNFGQWTGVNIKEAPLGWTPVTGHQRGDSDLPDNYLMIQNNVATTSIKALETRLDTLPVCSLPDPKTFDDGTFAENKFRFTGVSYLYKNLLFVAIELLDHDEDDNESDDAYTATGNQMLCYYELTRSDKDTEVRNDDSKWHRVNLYNPNLWADETQAKTITDIYVFQDTLIALADFKNKDELAPEAGHGTVFVASIEDVLADKPIETQVYIENPTTPPVFEPMGDLEPDLSATPVCRVTVRYCFTNLFGSTLPSNEAVLGVNYTPVEWQAGRFLRISGDFGIYNGDLKGITGVDFYASIDENADMIFIGHINVEPDATEWYFDWYGAMNDTTQWTSVQLTLPAENNTEGPDATYVKAYDGRLYWYGGIYPNRLQIGGDPGNELSVARGLGGGFVDLDPGSDLIITNVLKFKTYNGASIVTILCGSQNTNHVKRFNLLETNLTVTNELQSKGWEAEEVSNVVGCNSHWGSGVFADGLYTLTRYGLGLTTQQMEESNTLKVQLLSDPIAPVFLDRLGKTLTLTHMIFCDDVIYFALGVKESESATAHTALDRVIFAYDVNLKSWYTYTYDGLNYDEDILSIFPFDYWEWEEGIGIITSKNIVRIPVTGEKSKTAPQFTSLIETGELGLRLPPQLYVWLAQIEIRFDYFVGDVDIEIFGLDYYGREYLVHHELHRDHVVYELPVWIRVDKNVQTYRMRIKGKAHYRLTHFISKTYQQSDKMAIQYGYNAYVDYTDSHGNHGVDHHYLDSYNNLRDAIVT